MGNNKRFKKKTTPERSYPNTYDYDGRIEDEKDISFYLVQIDRKLAKESPIGTSVVLKENKNTIEVHSSKGRIGNVPISKINLVRMTSLQNGTVTNTSQNFDRIRVTLNM